MEYANSTSAVKCAIWVGVKDLGTPKHVQGLTNIMLAQKHYPGKIGTFGGRKEKGTQCPNFDRQIN